MIFRVANDRDLAAVRAYHVAFRYGFSCVICAFGMNIRFESEQQLFNCRLIENRDVSNNLGAVWRRQDGPARSFLNRDLFVRVDADDKYIAQLASAREITNVAYMKDVETAISKNDSSSRIPGRSDAFY